MESDRREYIRVKNEFNVRVARELTNETFRDLIFVSGTSIDVSASGILFTVSELLQNDDVIRVTFLKPNTFEFFEGLARVVRVDKETNDKYSVAVSFFNLTGPEKKQLDYYVTLCR
jgi:c-di-GMP-binding flagellar brake protein YcgR